MTTDILPDEHARAASVGRVHDPESGGPCLVHLRGDRLADVTA